MLYIWDLIQYRQEFFEAETKFMLMLQMGKLRHGGVNLYKVTQVMNMKKRLANTGMLALSLAFDSVLHTHCYDKDTSWW